MNKLNFLPKLAFTSLASAIAVFGITNTPVQALEGGTLEWDDGTDSFIGEVDFDTLGSTFDVLFSPNELAAVFIADGHFEPFFPGVPPGALFPLAPALGEFVNTDPDLEIPETENSAEFGLTSDLVFEFDNGVVATLPQLGTVIDGELLEDGAVEFELIDGEWEFDLPDNPDTPEFDPKSIVVQSSVLEFGQTAASPGGGYIAEATKVTTPEPGTILGLLAVGGLGLGLKRKKQS